MRLTKAVLDKAQYEGDGTERCALWDAEIPGLGLRVYPSGRKAFILMYRNRYGQKRLATLGTYGVLPLPQARDKARLLLADVLGGQDPVVERAQDRAGATMKTLCNEYLERHAKQLKKSWSEDERRIKAHLELEWGNLKVAAITRADVARLHQRIGAKRKYEANRTLALLSKMFNLARVWGFLPEGAANPAVGIEYYREEKRDRWVKAGEMPDLFDSIKQEENVYVRSALLLYLLTGARKNELLAARWEDIDTERAEWRLPETKQGRPHVIPLSGPALEILESIPRLKGNPYVLPGFKGETGHLVNITKAWERIRTRAELADVRLHDLRRTVGSWMAVDGASLLVIGKALGHSRASTTQIYARLSEDPVRAALERHGRKLMAVAERKPDAKVVDFAKDR